MKKKKKEKHKKKSKKNKTKKHNRSDSSESEDEWEESGVSTTKVTPGIEDSFSASSVQVPVPLVDVEGYKEEPSKREEWMSTSLFDVACGATNAREHKTKERKMEARRKEEEKNQEIYNARELNPYYRKIEQPGLPKGQSVASVKHEPKYTVPVGDGGNSWIHKAYERAKERAKEENIPLEDIVKQRWGSMEKLEALLKVASRNSKPTHSISKQSGSSGWRKRDKQNSSSSAVKPSTGDILTYGIDAKDVKHNKNIHTGDRNDSGTKKGNYSNSGSSEIVMKKILSEEEKNKLNAKLIRAELMGDTDLVTELKMKLEGGMIANVGKHDNIVQEIIKDDMGAKEILHDNNELNKTVTRNALSEEEKNKLNAKLLRAELMGDDDLVAKLKIKLDGGIVDDEDKHSNLIRGKRKDDSSSGSEEEIILTRSDKHGNLYPIKLNADDSGKTKRKKKIISTHDKSGERTRYFEDDDSTDLKTMVEQERLTSADDQQAMLARLAGKHLGRTMGEDYTIDDMFVQASATKGETKVENRRIRERAIAEDKLQKKQVSNCRYCFENPNIAKHLIISIGTNVYISLPITASLTEGHCLIIPRRHVAAQTYLDEDVLQEIKKFKKGLARMFADMNEDVMFLETCKNLRNPHHCVIECIPVPKEVGDMAPIYFKKAISETGSEWSDNKKLVTITSKGGVTGAIPKGLPYFAVEFGLDDGFGHIIEEESFPHYFGKEIIGGMLDLEPRIWLKPPKESFELHKRKVLKFTDSWKKHDCTSQIT